MTSFQNAIDLLHHSWKRPLAFDILTRAVFPPLFFVPKDIAKNSKLPVIWGNNGDDMTAKEIYVPDAGLFSLWTRDSFRLDIVFLSMSLGMMGLIGRSFHFSDETCNRRKEIFTFCSKKFTGFQSKSCLHEILFETITWRFYCKI